MTELLGLIIVPPQGSVLQSLEKFIRNLGQAYHGPIFEPHLTLLDQAPENVSQQEMISKTKVLASQLKPFTITLEEPFFSTTVHHCVFIAVKPTAELLKANLLAKKIFGVKNTFFFPHMSLLYGNQSLATREKIVSTLKFPKGLSFKATQLVAVTDSGSQDLSKWIHLAKFNLLSK